MSLLLDALKKSEAQRRRGTAPTIDLSRTPPSGNPRRPGLRWLPFLLVVVLLAAAAPWLWPKLSDWMEQRSADPGESGALVEAEAAAPTVGDEAGAAVAALQSAPAPVAGASSPRRVAAGDPTPAGGAGQDPARSGDDSAETSGEAGVGTDPVAANAVDGDGPDDSAAGSGAAVEASDSNTGASMAEMRRMVQARQQQQQQKPQPQPQVDAQESPARPAAPTENFIRPWELPQAQRAEFPELSLTVHFYAERAADRFVLINGERYREGQRVGPGTRLAEIRQRGAVVEFGSYRVLIE